MIDLTGGIHGNKIQKTGSKSVFGREKSAIADAVAAFIAVQIRLNRLPAWIPYGTIFFYVIIFPVGIKGYIIVPVTGNAQQFGILKEAVAAAGILHQ